MALKSNEKFSTINYTEGNSIASLTQMVVGKGIPNPLIVEGLLKVLRELILLFPPTLFPIFVHGMVRPQKGCNCLLNEIIIEQTCYVNIIPRHTPPLG